jgi:hypothetical protein
MDIYQISNAVAEFRINLENSITMEERKQSVQWLADKIGVDAANTIAAEEFGLKSDYYRAA